MSHLETKNHFLHDGASQKLISAPPEPGECIVYSIHSKVLTCQMVYVQTRELGILVIIWSGHDLVCLRKTMLVFVDFR